MQLQVVNSSECPTGKDEQDLGVEIPLSMTSIDKQDKKAQKRRDSRGECDGLAGLVMSIDLHEPRPTLG